MQSIWKHDLEIHQKEAVTEQAKAEQPMTEKPIANGKNVHTLIIGAGMAGILTAYLLKQKGIDAMIVEAKTIASGQTENTTAKITSQHDIFYNKLLQKTGRKRAKSYAMANEEAIRIFEQIIRKENIDCEFEKKPAYLYTLNKERIPELQNEAKVAKMLGIDAKYVEGKEISELPFEVKGAVRFQEQAQFHPLKFVMHLAKELNIYENTKVLSVKGHRVETNQGIIWAENIIFACHYPITNVPGFYFLRQHQERSYVLALESKKKLEGMYYSVDTEGLSLRSAGNALLLGGGAHRTGKKLCQLSDHEQEKYGYRYLRKMAEVYYKENAEITHWSAQDCMPHDEIPFIGKYSLLRPYWYVATGFKKWGMTASMVSAMIISSQITGSTNLYEATFTPQRLLFRAGIKNFLVDLGESVMGLAKGLFGKKERRCTHMGCLLEWNNEEDSWDCPCHGSRFEKNGELRDNPAQIDIKQK